MPSPLVLIKWSFVIAATLTAIFVALLLTPAADLQLNIYQPK
ncbi:MAG: hypothetical protein ACI9CE_002575 [Flavobacterium sp.]|jgi:hypothetical protein